jgi:hypothetical protein
MFLTPGEDVFEVYLFSVDVGGSPFQPGEKFILVRRNTILEIVSKKRVKKSFPHSRVCPGASNLLYAVWLEEVFKPIVDAELGWNGVISPPYFQSPGGQTFIELQHSLFYSIHLRT